MTKAENEEHFKGFQKLFARYLAGNNGIVWDKIEPLPQDAVITYASLNSSQDTNAIKQMLKRLVVIKLNGGLGKCSFFISTY